MLKIALNSTIVLLMLISTLSVVGTVLPLLQQENWWVRAFDFPRYQLFVLALIAAGGLSLIWWQTNSLNLIKGVLIGLLLSSALYQAYRVYPYLPIAPKMSLPVQKPKPERQLNIMISNVYMENDNSDLLLQRVQEVSPDILLVVETDKQWLNWLSPLKKEYKHVVEVPKDNTYGMALYSRLPLNDTTVRYLLQDDVPSIRTKLTLSDGEQVTFYGIHPRPPSPQESNSSLPRDAELIVVAKEIRQNNDEPTVVAGDMNDVAWSDTTKMFLKLTALLDPRRGRGLYNTFDVNIPPLRVPLDHVFHSKHFRLVHIERLEDVDSDHFPINIQIQLADRPTVNRSLKMTEKIKDMAEDKLKATTSRPDTSLPSNVNMDIKPRDMP